MMHGRDCTCEVCMLGAVVKSAPPSTTGTSVTAPTTSGNGAAKIAEPIQPTNTTPTSKKSKTQAQGASLQLEDAEPASDPVDGVRLLNEIVIALRKYVVMLPAAYAAVALWIAMTYLTEHVEALPRLVLMSPTRACGKSRLLALLAALVRRALAASSISAASMFRAIDAGKPTLLLDEMDNKRWDEDPEMKALLNSGHTRGSAWTVRTVGEQHEPRRFSTWAPVALASIGKLPDPVMSRSIRIPMTRRAPEERLERMRESRLGDELKPLRRKLARWCVDHAVVICNADPALPSGLDDRERDNWSPLVAIANEVGDEWPRIALAASLTLACNVDTEDEPVGVQLLHDLRALFRGHDVDWLGTEEILGELVKLEDRPWSEWRDGRPMTSHALGRLLRPFKVKSEQNKERTKRGYSLASFRDAFRQYPDRPSETSNVSASANGAAAPMTLRDASDALDAFLGRVGSSGPAPIGSLQEGGEGLEWEPARGVTFPTERDHEAARPRPNGATLVNGAATPPQLGLEIGAHDA